MGKVINTAIVGFGMSGEYFHAAFLDADPNFCLKKVVERHSNRSKHLYPYIEVVKDFSAVLDDDDIELVIINTPNHLHFEMAKKALINGKHVVVEKPFTTTTKEADELINIALTQKKILTVYQNRRWDGDFLTVKKIIESKMLGELVEFESHFDRFRNYIKPNSWKEEILPGAGLLYDIASHLIDQSVCLFGNPVSVFADLRTQRPSGKIIDAFEVILNYNKLKVTLKSNYLSKIPLPRFTLHGTEGSYIKNGLDPQEETLKKIGYRKSLDWGAESPDYWGMTETKINGLVFSGEIETIAGSYSLFYENLYDAIENSRELAVKPGEAMNTIRIIELAIESCRKGCIIKF
ncbi:MAG: Gfo/Idh/MocA family oxidoreductase [Ignavibacteriaceae bacterium]|jgi:predicted dehydrogenase